MGILTDNNIVRIIVFNDETDPTFSRRLSEYCKISPIIIDPYCDDDTEVLDESYFLSYDDGSTVLVMIKATSQAFTNNGVYGVYYCGYEPTDLEIFDFIKKLESGEFIDEKVLVDETELYQCTENGFSFKLQMSNDAFDKIIDSLEPSLESQLIN